MVRNLSVYLVGALVGWLAGHYNLDFLGFRLWGLLLTAGVIVELIRKHNHNKR